MPAVAARMTSAQRGNLRYIGVLSIHLDGRRILRVPINLEELLTLDGGRAYVGFTGATGVAYQEHSVVNWRFNASKQGTLLEPANLHCRTRVPSLWHATGYEGSPILEPKQALACTPGVMDSATPVGSMHSILCSEDEQSGVVYCRDPNMRNVPPILNDDVPLPDLSALVGVPLDHTLPRDAFLDRQSDGRLTSVHLNYTLSFATLAELSWLKFDATDNRLHGTPTHPGTWAITVIASDPGFREGADPPLSTTDEFLLHVRPQPVRSEAGARVPAEDPLSVHTAEMRWRDHGRSKD
jgi:hypothetical protein